MVPPVLARYLPAAQAVQAELPVFALYLPAAQAVQAELLVLPVFALYLPAPQDLHQAFPTSSL